MTRSDKNAKSQIPARIKKQRIDVPAAPLPDIIRIHLIPGLWNIIVPQVGYAFDDILFRVVFDRNGL